MNQYELGVNCNVLIFSDEFFGVFLVRQQNPLYICIAKNDRFFVFKRIPNLLLINQLSPRNSSKRPFSTSNLPFS